MPRISIAIPVYDGMKNGDVFLKRALQSIKEQTFTDYEVVVTKDGKMAENTNSAINQCKGDIIKVLYQDDYLAHKDALQDIVNVFDTWNDGTDMWLITGTDTNPHPVWTDDIETGNNKLGSPSALSFRRQMDLRFDERMSWLLDVKLYMKMYKKYGLPVILDSIGVNIGQGPHQMTHILTDEEKLSEYKYLQDDL